MEFETSAMFELLVLEFVRATMSVTAGIKTAASPTRIINTTISSTRVKPSRLFVLAEAIIVLIFNLRNVRTWVRRIRPLQGDNVG